MKGQRAMMVCFEFVLEVLFNGTVMTKLQIFPSSAIPTGGVMTILGTAENRAIESTLAVGSENQPKRIHFVPRVSFGCATESQLR
jgi:hypothetical protein